MKKKYVPNSLSPSDKIQQYDSIMKSRKAYKKGIYLDRPRVQSFQGRPSRHVRRAKQKYNLNTFTLNEELAKKTKCSLTALRQIFKKGQGAFYSSGSRPNQTSYSWATARVASAITGGKAAIVDKDILLRGCHPDSPVFF